MGGAPTLPLIHRDEMTFKPSDMMGSGAFGRVYKGQWASTEVAIKEIKVRRQALIDEALKSEVFVHSLLRHGEHCPNHGSRAFQQGSRVPTRLYTLYRSMWMDKIWRRYCLKRKKAKTDHVNAKCLLLSSVPGSEREHEYQE